MWGAAAPKLTSAAESSRFGLAENFAPKALVVASDPCRRTYHQNNQSLPHSHSLNPDSCLPLPCDHDPVGALFVIRHQRSHSHRCVQQQFSYFSAISTQAFTLPRLQYKPMASPAPPSTPKAASAPAATPDGSQTPGKWRHPHLNEVVRRQNAGTFGDRNINKLVWNTAALFATWVFGDTVKSYSLWLQNISPISTYPDLSLLVLRVIFALNILIALYPLFRPKDNFSDIPLTPTQRSLLGLDPSATQSLTPGTTQQIRFALVSKCWRFRAQAIVRTFIFAFSEPVVAQSGHEWEQGERAEAELRIFVSARAQLILLALQRIFL
ncbi:hypothetical protein CBS147346_10347 [Aspergillus niger]|nr:hypothetical protein CBS147346_10347 [Aspergillus niger]